MIIHILTLFPEMFQGALSHSMLKRAQERGLVEVHLHNFRDFAHDRHRTVDDYPYGGGPGMVLMPGPLFEAVESVQQKVRERRGEAAIRETPVILLSPQGRRFTQAIAQELAGVEEMVLVCGHYEGVDERVMEHLATDQLSIGDYVLTGGEPAAAVVIDAVARLIPGVLHDIEAARDDSFATGILQGPHYTRPPAFRGWDVPAVLLSGNHAEVARWRRQQALLRTLKRRPDLLGGVSLTPQEQSFLQAAQRLEAARRHAATPERQGPHQQPNPAEGRSGPEESRGPGPAGGAATESGP